VFAYNTFVLAVSFDDEALVDAERTKKTLWFCLLSVTFLTVSFHDEALVAAEWTKKTVTD